MDFVAASRSLILSLLTVLYLSAPLLARPETSFIANAGDPKKAVYWRFEAEPLSEVLSYLNREIGWSLGLDLPASLQERTVTVEFDGVGSLDALKEVLKAQGLGIDARPGYHDFYFSEVREGTPLALPDFSQITSSFSLAGSVPGLEIEIRFVSDGQRARWQALPLSLTYLWCGNSWDFWEQNSLDQRTYERLKEQADSLIWRSDTTPAKVRSPQGVYTLKTDSGWYRDSAEKSKKIRSSTL